MGLLPRTARDRRGRRPVVARLLDRHADSFLAAHDLASGKRLWQVARDERPVWATPLLHEAEVKTPSPFASDELIVFTGGYRGRPL